VAGFDWRRRRRFAWARFTFWGLAVVGNLSGLLTYLGSHTWPLIGFFGVTSMISLWEADRAWSALEKA
jgi:hypothetical protein